MLSFNSRQDVKDYLEELGFDGPYKDGSYRQPSVYILSHGEADRPDFYPQKYKSDWGIRVAYNYFPSTYNAPKNGRVYIFVEGDNPVSKLNYEMGNY